MSPIHYLTVQDMLWINHRVTGKVLPFRYDLLEEATFYQYGYGQLTDLAAQAQKFLTGFSKKPPFPEGNNASAFVGGIALLRANGMSASVDEKALQGWLTSNVDAPELKVVEGIAVHGQPDVRAIIEEVLANYGHVLNLPEKVTA